MPIMIDPMRSWREYIPRRHKARVLFACLILYIGVIAAVAADSPIARIQGKPRPRVAVVLSGGSAFGIAHIGVLKKIEEAGIPIDMILGTSMGSIVGGLYAAGYSPQAMQDLISSIDWSNLFMERKSLPQNMFERSVESLYAFRIRFDSKGPNFDAGLLEGQNILSFFTALTIHMSTQSNFDNFPVPYRAVAANLFNGDKEVLDHGSLAEAMRSSMSIPVIFMPYDYNGKLLVDGGIVDNLPVDIARQMGADIVIAVVSRNAPPDSIDELNSSVEIGGQTGNLLILQNMRLNEKAADLVITPNLKDFTTASYARAKEIIARGEEAGEAAMPQLRELASKISLDRPLIPPADQPNRKALIPPPVFSSLRIEGGSESDKSKLESIFSSLVDREYTREELQSTLRAAYSSGDFSLVKFNLETTGQGQNPDSLCGVVSITPRKPVENEFFMSLDYRGAISKSIQSNIVASSAFLAKELTGPGSVLLASLSFVNKTSASVEYFQPLRSFFIMPWARFRYEYDMYTSENSTLATALQFKTYGVGTWAGFVVGNIADIMVGYSFEKVLAGDSWTSLSTQNAGALRAAFRLDTRDSTVFPRRGVALTAYGRWFDPNFGGTTAFAQAELNASVAFSLAQADALQLNLFGGTDFAGIISGAQPAKVAYYPTVNQPLMFYGLVNDSKSCAGNSVMAGSLEYRHRIRIINELTGANIYLFANGSVGAVVAYDDPSTYDLWPLKWGATIGANARLSPHYGILVGMGLLGNTEDMAALAPAFVIQFGSFDHSNVLDRR